MIPSRRTPAPLALLLVLAAPLGAQQRPDSARARADTVFVLAPVVVTASRLPVQPDRLGFAVTVVEPGPATSPYAADMVRDVAGSFLDEAVGPGGPAIIRLRGGEEVFTQVLVDGVQVNQNGGFFDFQGLTLSNLDRVEVARGPQSAVYGSSAVSGVVHYLTPRGGMGEPRLTLRGEGGGAREHGGGWSLGGSVRGGWERLRYSAGGGSSYARGIYALPHDTRTRDGSVRLDWAPAPGLEATLLARRVDMASLLPVRDAGTTRVPLDPNARNDRDRTVASAVVRFAPGGAWRHHARFSVYREDFAYQDAYDGVAAPAGEAFFVFDANLLFESSLERTTAEVGGNARTGPVDAAWGLAWEREELHDRISGDFGGDPVLLDRSSVAGFAEAAWRASSEVTVGAGVRWEKYQGIGSAEATPRASVRWSPAGAPVALRAAVGRAYKAPNLQQQYVDNPFIVANPDLRAERSTSVEAGLDFPGDEGGWSGGVTVFRQGFRDLIRTVALEGDTRQINRNLGSSRATGVEWRLRVPVTSDLSVEGDGAWTATRVVDNAGLSGSEYPEGAPLPFRPSVVGRLALAWDAGGPLRARLHARHVGAQTVLTERFSGRRVRLGGYTLLGASASWALSDGVVTFVRLENVLDRAYVTAFDRPGIPATGAVGLQVTF